MTAAFSKIKARFAGWREWEVNPVVIKELRQAVRSWSVTGVLLLFLTVLFVAAVIFLVSQSLDEGGDDQLGGELFGWFVSLLGIASILFIPFYTGTRVAMERQESNPDLLYVSTLTPGQIIRGKFLCGAYVTVLFFSACLPFMAFTNLLRGVDLPSIFFILLVLFLVVCALNQLAIFLACLPLTRPFRILLGLVGLVMSFWLIIPLVIGLISMMHSGIGAMMADSNFWMTAATFGGAGLAMAGLLYFLSVALISPASANRALPLRVYLTLIWLFGGLLTFGWVWHSGEPELMLVWTWLTFVLLQFALLVSISNSDRLSRRVQRRIPQSRLARVPAFVFFNGAAGGLVWLAAIAVLTCFATTEIRSFWPAKLPGTQPDFSMIYSATTAYAFAYALTALFVHRKFLSKRPARIAGVLAVLLAGLWAIAPSAVLFFLNRLTWRNAEGLQLGNIFNAFYLSEDARLYYHLIFALGWLALALVLNAKWFWTQVKHFRPPRPDVPPVLQ